MTDNSLNSSVANTAAPAIEPAPGVSSATAFKLLMRVRTQSILSALGLYSKDNGGAIALTILTSLKTILIMLVAITVSAGLGIFLSFSDPSSTPALAATVESVVALLLTVGQAGGVLFGQRDLDFRMSLPISTRVMTMSQIAAFFLYQVLWSIAIMLPMCIAYLVVAQGTALQALFLLVCVLLTPMVPVSLGILIAFAVSLFSSRFRYSSLVYIVVGMVALVLMYTLWFGHSSFSTPEASMDALNQAVSAVRVVAYAYPLSAWIAHSMSGAVLSGVFFVVVSFAVPALVVELFSRLYLRINAILASRLSGHTVKLDASATRSSAPLMAMCKMEFKRIFSIPQYAIDCMFGNVMVIVLAIVVAVMGSDASINILVIQYGHLDESAAAAAMDFLSVVFPWVIAFLVSASPSSACAISIEGPNAWIMATAPLSTKDVLMSKVYASMLQTAVAAIFAAIALVATGAIDLIGAIEILLLAGGLTFFNACLGIVMDCKSPNYSWIKPEDAMKRGKGRMTVVIVDLAEIVVGGILTMVVCIFGGLTAGEIVVAALGIAGFVGGFMAINSASKKPIYIVK